MRYSNPRRNLLSAAISLGLLLATCTTSTPANGQVTITFACKDYQRKWYQDLARDFEKANRDIRVQIVSADEASGRMRQGNTVIASADDFGRLAGAADTFVWSTSLHPTDWVYVLNLQSFVDGDDSFPFEDFYPSALDEARWQGDLHGLPAEMQPLLIFYDKDAFDKANVAYPEIGWTWDDFLEAASQLTERNEDETSRYGFVAPDFSSAYIVIAMMDQHGVPLWNEDADPPEPLLDRPEVTHVLHRYVDLALTHEVMPIPEPDSGIGHSLINEGKAAMWVDYAFHYDYYANRTNLDVASFPEAVAAANPRYTSAFFIGAGTAHPEAAWRWLLYLSEHYKPFMLNGAFPGRRSVSEQMGWWKKLDEDAKAAIEHVLAYPANPDNHPLWGPLLRAVFAVLEGEASFEEALATAQSQALDLQAELASATPVPLQPIASPQATPAGVETMLAFAPDPGADMSVYRALAATFRESHPDVWVEVVPPSYDLAGGTDTSDCFGGAFPIQDAVARETIRSLDPFLEADASVALDDFYPALLEQVRQNGELWGLPYQTDALMVYYNRQLFDEADIAPPEPGWSIADFLDAASALSGGGQYGFTTREGAYGDLVLVLERLGAHLVDPGQQPPVPTFDDPTVVAALTRYVDLSRRQSLTPATPSTQSGWPDNVVWGTRPAGVESGHVAMWVDYVGNHAFSPPLSFDVGVAPLPTRGGGAGSTRATTEFNVKAYYVSAHTSAPQACWEWLTFLSHQPESVRLLPARRSVAASPSWQGQWDETALPAYRATLAYDDVSLFDLRWEIPGFAYTYPWLEEAYRATVDGEDAGRALADAQRKAEAYIQCLERENGFDDLELLKTCAREVDPDYPKVGE